MTEKDREELQSAIDNINQIAILLPARAEIAKLKIERVLLRNPPTALAESLEDTGYSSISVVGGWQTFDRLRQKAIGPAFNSARDLWDWQKANLS